VNTKQFGRWAEACTARYLRDKGLSVWTADAWNFTPYIDFTASQYIGTENQQDYHIQVKGTSVKRDAGFPFHYSTVARCVGYAEGSLKAGQEFLFVVVSLPNRLGYFFGGSYLAGLCREADCSNGDHYSSPGMLRLEPALSLARFPLTTQEIAEGETIVMADTPESPQRPLFG